MAVYKCKMCGGTLEVQQGVTTCECEYCGTVQTIPSVKEEDIQNLFNRANILRMKAEFDKASDIYERIVQTAPSEAEAYWGLVLCKYGVEYVEDPVTHKRVPTCHRTSYEAVVSDEDYRSAIEHADMSQRLLYEEEAKAIDEIQKGILAIADQESDYDVFICYKEVDESGNRTVDSVIANDIYHELTQEGFKVFYSAITLEEKLGTDYEPYIFSALNSAKVMLVIGTKPEYFNAVWVKNEWSRFLKLMQKDRSRTLIPCYRDMDAYELPEEFAHLQAEDMSKIGFINDITRGIRKLIGVPEGSTSAHKDSEGAGSSTDSAYIANANALLKRAFMFLEDGDWDKADQYCEQVLDMDPENAQAYVGKLMAELNVKRQSALSNESSPFDDNGNYKKAIRFGDDSLQEKLKEDNDIIRERNRTSQLDRNYNIAEEIYNNAATAHEYLEAANFFEKIIPWKDSEEKCRLAKEKAQNLKYDKASQKYDAASTEQEYLEAASLFREIISWRDSAARSQDARKKAEEARKDAIYDEAIKNIDSSQKSDLQNSISLLESISGWKDADGKIEECKNRIIDLEKIEEKKKKESEERHRVRKKRYILISVICVAVIAVIIIFVLIRINIIVPRNEYEVAMGLFNNGQYQESYEAFTALGDYDDSERMVTEAKNRRDYKEAEELIANNQYMEAIAVFEDLGDYGDSAERIEECKQLQYELAEIYLEAGELQESALAFGKIDDYKDAEERSFLVATLQPFANQTISAGYCFTVGVTSYGGRVVAVGNNDRGQCNVSEWTDIVSVSAGGDFTVGLKPNGTVVAAGHNYHGQCDVSDWTDIVAISAGEGFTLGLKSDGTVVAVGDNDYGQCNVSDWTYIIAVSAGYDFSLGLKSDGTVVAVGKNDYGQCNVSEWTDIVAISAGDDFAVGLKSDGTAVAVGNHTDDQCDVSGWRNIVAISASSRNGFIVGLTSYGTVMGVGNNSYGEYDGVLGWTDIVAISAGSNFTVGLKSDGTVVAVGHNKYGQCDVSGWSNIVIPD